MVIAGNEINIHVNLLSLLADVVETLMLDTESLMKKQNRGLRHEYKRNWNAALHSLRNIKSLSINKTSNETQCDYGNDSDHLYEFIKLLIDRCGNNDRTMFDLYNKLLSMPTKIGLTNLNSDVFSSIEYEEERKSSKCISLIQELYGVSNLKDASKPADAYDARVLCANMLERCGFDTDIIAKKMGLSVKTVKGLIKVYPSKLENKKFKSVLEKFYDRFYEKKSDRKTPRNAEVA